MRFWFFLLAHFLAIISLLIIINFSDYYDYSSDYIKCDIAFMLEPELIKSCLKELPDIINSGLAMGKSTISGTLNVINTGKSFKYTFY